MQKLVVLSGAGMSAESGIPTFRGIDGLWKGHRVEEVASPGGWQRNPALVLEFYNQRRKRAWSHRPIAVIRFLRSLNLTSMSPLSRRMLTISMSERDRARSCTCMVVEAVQKHCRPLSYLPD